MRLLVLALLTLTACGADGPPERPAAETSVTITGEAAFGLSGQL